MSKKLVIVESPGKIKKITSILGNDYLVMASVGHIRNLDPKGLGIDVNNNFKPNNIIVSNKKKVVRNLKEAVSDRRATIQYTDYAFWQSKNEINTNGLKYWKNKLSGDLPILNLPTDFKRPLQPTFKGAASFTQTYNKELSSKLLSLSKQLETTPYVLLLSVYFVFLYR